MKKVFLFCFVSLVLVLGESSGFRAIKKKLTSYYLSLPKEQQKTFYCQVPFKETEKGKLRVVDSKLYTPRKKKTLRDSRIEWEHIVPISYLAKDMDCWKNGGRKNCEKDPDYVLMETDPVNLVPAIGTINGDRKNFIYNDKPDDVKDGMYGKCPVTTDFKNKQFYPADYSKAYIAYVYLYMASKYKVVYPTSVYSLMFMWQSIYPLTPEELKRLEYLRELSLKR